MIDVGGHLRSFFFKNVGLKLVALLGSLVIFSVVRGAEDARRSVSVDVVATVPLEGSDKVLVSDLPASVRITLQGSRSLLNSVKMTSIPVDLTDTDASYFYFDPSAFEVPAGVSVVQIAPASIPLDWELVVQRRVDVQATIRGTPTEGLALSKNTSIKPNRVRAKGAQNRVDALSMVLTSPFDISTLNEGTHVRRIKLEPPPPHVFWEVNSVELTVSMIPDRASRLMKGVKVESLGPRATLRPPKVDITFDAPPGKVDTVDADSVVPWVDATTIPPDGTYTLKVRVKGLPPWARVVSVEPAEVFTTVKHR